MYQLKLSRISTFLFLKEVLKILSLLHVVSCEKSGQSATVMPSNVQPPPPAKDAASVKAAFEKHNIVPDIIDEAPNQTLTIALSADNYVDFGNYMVPALWETQPTKIRFEGAQRDRMYVLIMTEPDHPSQSTASGNEWYHWVLGDIPGTDFQRGKTVIVYVGPVMKETSGMHRVVYLLFEQLDGRIIYEEKHLTATKNEKKRARHNTRRFAAKYNLTGPVAGNFFMSGYNYENK